MPVKTLLEGTILSKIVDKIALSEPRTTVLGVALSAIVLAKIDYGKLLQADPTQIANLVSALIISILGYYTNNKGLKVETGPTDPRQQGKTS